MTATTRPALAVVLLGLLLTGCATMNRSECLTADWRTVGMEDGSRGELPGRLGEHREACAAHGVTPDLDAYQAGREEGLRDYCQSASGFYHGKSGHGYKGVCPDYLEGEFLAGYEQGRRLYNIDQDINEARNQAQQKRNKIDSLRSSIAQKEGLLLSDTTSKGQRSVLLSDIKEMERQIGRLQSDINQLEYRRSMLESDYRRAEEQAGFY